MEGLPEEGCLHQAKGPRSVKVVGEYGARQAGEGIWDRWSGSSGDCYKLVNHRPLA